MRRHHMRKIRELLRLRFEKGCSHREIAAALGMSKGSVNSALHRAEALGLSWDSALALGDVELERKLYPSTRAAAACTLPDRLLADRPRDAAPWRHADAAALGGQGTPPSRPRLLTRGRLGVGVAQRAEHRDEELDLDDFILGISL
jgi:transcriptional regulator with XRE-family HTH domain